MTEFIFNLNTKILSKYNYYYIRYIHFVENNINYKSKSKKIKKKESKINKKPNNTALNNKENKNNDKKENSKKDNDNNKNPQNSNIEGINNCMFRALSEFIYGNEFMHQNIRLKIYKEAIKRMPTIPNIILGTGMGNIRIHD